MSLFMAQSHYSKNRTVTSMLLGKICSRPVTFLCVFFLFVWGVFAVRDQQQIVQPTSGHPEVDVLSLSITSTSHLVLSNLPPISHGLSESDNNTVCVSLHRCVCCLSLR